MFSIFRVSKSLCVGGAFLAFSLAVFGQTNTNYSISVNASPTNEGTVGINGTASLDGATNAPVAASSTNLVSAMTNGGYAFAYWTLNGSVIKAPTNLTFTYNSNYSFVPTSLAFITNLSPVTNLEFVAFFGPACSVTVSNSPANEGASGGFETNSGVAIVDGVGTFASNSPITVIATNANGYGFTNWTSNGVPVSSNASYTFTLNTNVELVANFVPNPLVTLGPEFSVLGHVQGDQVLPSLSLSSAGGCIAWQDNIIDKAGGGIGASLLNSGFYAGQPFRINKVVTGLQLKPQVQLLANDNIIFVWQGSVTATSIPNIYARFAKSPGRGGTYYGTNFYTSDIQVNTYKLDQQVDPAVAALPDGSAIITWSSYGENGSGSMWGVYARRLTAAGTAIRADNDGSTKQFLVTQYTSFNQRNPAVATLASGNYVITWVSEQESGPNNIDIYARIFTIDGVPVTDEIMVSGTNIAGGSICHVPAVAPLTDGGFTVVWAQKDVAVPANSWDIWGRAFSASGSPETSPFTINTTLYGDQYAPKIAAGPAGSLAVWTSLGQDGSREGVYGRFLQGGTNVAGGEFQVNTTWISQQIHPAVAWDGVDHFLVVWSSFVGASGFDLYGQAYVLNSSP